MDLGTTLGIWAHPDDDIYLSSGLMAENARLGNRVVDVTATRGEGGSMDEERWPPDTMAEVRTAELLRSLEVLGVREHRFLDGFVDVDMDAPLGDGTDQVRAIVEEVRPDAILTFDGAGTVLFANRAAETLFGYPVAAMIGQPVTMPVALAPVGSTGMRHPDGEILSARAAAKFGVPYTLSTMSICSIEDVRAATRGPFWFQLYVFRDRGFSESVIERAKAAGCTALFLTVDLPMRGQRHCDIKNGLTVPPRLTARNALDILTKPSWALGVLLSKRKSFGNIDTYLNNTTVKVVVQNVQVLAVQPKSGEQANLVQPAGGPEPDVIVILAVTPQQAEIVRHLFLLRNGQSIAGAPSRAALEALVPFGAG